MALEPMDRLAGLTGYAKAYKQALDTGQDNTSAHLIANALTQGSGISVPQAQQMGTGVQQSITPNSYGNGYAASKYDSYGKQLTPTIAGSLLNPTAQPKQPNVSVQYEQPAEMDWQEAWQRASSMLDPKYNAAKNTTLNAYATQRENLPALLNARGQLYGGLRAGGESAITNKQAAALENLQLEYAAQKQQMAAAIQAQESAKAREIANALYRSQVDNANLAMQQYNNSMNQWNADRSFGYNALVAALEGQRSEEASALANQLQRDQMAQQKDLAMLDYTQGLTPWQQAQLDLDLKKFGLQEKEFALSQTKRGSGTGGGDKTGTNPGTGITDAMLVQARLLADNDPRLAKDAPADGVNYFTRPQLIDAYVNQLKAYKGIGGSAGSGAYSDEELASLLG